MSKQRITEGLAPQYANGTLDATTRTVRQRIIAEGTSRNGRVYDKALLMAAAAKFENAQTYADHPQGNNHRSITELTGWLSGVSVETDGLYATRHFTQTRAGTDAFNMITAIVEGKAPASLLGSSINYLGKSRKEGDKLIIESIDRVLSVDDVTAPAAGGGWVAESQADPLGLGEWLTFEEWYALNPNYTQRVVRECSTVRQDKALTEAQALAERYLEQVTALQAENAQLAQNIDGANKRIIGLLREQAIDAALAKATLPPAWKTALREQLITAKPEEWDKIIAGEIAKARLIKPPVNVQGAGQSLQESADKRPLGTTLPLRTEDADAWARRMETKG